jgi:hypothetical protein
MFPIPHPPPLHPPHAPTLVLGVQADTICTHNRHYAESSGYWLSTNFLQEQSGRETVFHDAVTGLALFVAPKVQAGAPPSRVCINHPSSHVSFPGPSWDCSS